MTTDPVRRQVLRALGGLVLAPVSACLPGDGHGTHSHPVQHDLLAALEESALLQIDLTDMCNVLSAIGDAPPVCSVFNGLDVDAVVKQCGDVLAQHHYPFNAVLVVVSGNQESLSLDDCRVFAAVTDAMVNSASRNASGSDTARTARNRLQSRLNAPPMVLHGVVVDAGISDGLRVTVLAG
ncbi:MAG TPA: hypothetical protein PK347_10095 [Burkholderiaceae bacterium]|nr:hypothetical protein [Burkholderiaceae bacterium]